MPLLYFDVIEAENLVRSKRQGHSVVWVLSCDWLARLGGHGRYCQRAAAPG
jgi:hypothetical protein